MEAERVWPTWGVPETAGTAVFVYPVGGAAETTVVCAEVAVALPY